MEFQSTPRRGATSARRRSRSASSPRASRSWRTAQAEPPQDLFLRAVWFEAQGRDEEAQSAYIDVIRREPAHVDALLNLGNLLYRRGYRRAARLTYVEAAKAAPGNPIVDVNLGNTFLENGELEMASAHFERALQLDDALPEAHQGMSYVFSRLGDERAAAAHRDAGFRSRAIARFPYRGSATAARVVVLVSALGGNVGTADVLDDRTFDVTRIFVEYFEGALPPCDAVFNAVGDADRCGEALRSMQPLLANVDVPVLNAPQAVIATQRAAIARTLAGIPSLRVPLVAQFQRRHLCGDASAALRERGFATPVLLRALGFHTGMFFERAETWDETAEIASRLPGEEVLAIEFLDARTPEGRYRKFRAMIVDGTIYPLHMAIAGRWKVHYVTGDTAKNEMDQALERRFLQDMEGAIGSKATEALTHVARRLGLDYGGIDFGLDAEGNVLLFEANATMIVPSRETNARLAYRMPFQQAVIDAARRMVMSRCFRSAESTRS